MARSSSLSCKTRSSFIYLLDTRYARTHARCGLFQNGAERSQDQSGAAEEMEVARLRVAALTAQNTELLQRLDRYKGREYVCTYRSLKLYLVPRSLY